METEERTVLAQSTYTPTYETERQRFRAMRSYRRIVLLCILYGALFTYLLVRIGIQLVKIFAFHVPVYAAISMWVSAVLLILFVYLFVTVLTAPRRNAKRRIRQLLETHPTVPSVMTTFYEDEVVIRSEGERNGLHLRYSVFRRIAETDGLFLLWTKEKQVFAVAKQGLAVVDPAGYRALIREKCPKATCRWRNEA
jgi:hypothetical protein